MSQKWISKGEGRDRKSFAIETERKPRERALRASDIGPSVSDLEREAWNLLGDLSKVTDVDELLHISRHGSAMPGTMPGGS